MKHSLVENADLPLAIAWERLREGYFRKSHQPQMADHCGDLANWHQARLNTVSEGQQPCHFE